MLGLIPFPTVDGKMEMLTPVSVIKLILVASIGAPTCKSDMSERTNTAHTTCFLNCQQVGREEWEWEFDNICILLFYLRHLHQGLQVLIWSAYFSLLISAISEAHGKCANNFFFITLCLLPTVCLFVT